ncbi:MAG: hypothetical protein Q4E62_10315, partial [Sutterellaceae bacterium]|nr:hypothetical protein [Sutterellaceae bacterium]
MPFNIEPLHIGIVAVLIIAGLAWYFTRKTKRDDSAAHEMAERIREGLKESQDAMASDTGGLKNAIAMDEPEVPVLSPADAVENAPKLEVEVEPEIEVVAPQPAPAETPVVRTESGRSAPSVDNAVEAVVYFTPKEEFFAPEALLKAAQAVETAQNKELITIDFFDVATSRWYHDVSMVTKCSQIYLSMLLANRTKKVDQLAASIFITLAGQMVIDLNAEAVLPDSAGMVERTEHIASIIKAFDNQLTLKIVCAH